MMLALEMFRSLPRHAAGRVVGGRMPGVLSGFAAPLRLMTIDEPRVDRPGWARLRTRRSGICGSDLGALSGRTSLYFSAVVTMPFVPGHEVVAELMDDCGDLPAGTRVVVDPVLTCAARGVDACESCTTGATNRCSRITVGHLAPGLQTGFCKDTGGGWGEQLVAHRSQLHVVPEGYSDEQAILIEPVACAVHTALAARVGNNDRVLVSGAGSVGLFATLALRSLTPAGEITVVAKHNHQRELALESGATEVVAPGEVLRRVRRTTGAFQVKPEFGSPYLLGGVDVAVDAVGKALGSLEGAQVLVLGLTYREGVHELAYSRGVALVEALRDAGAAVLAHDPLLADDEIRALGADPYRWGDASDAEAIVTQTADARWRQLDPAHFPELRLLVDGRNSLSDLALAASVAYRGVGVPARPGRASAGVSG